MKLIKTLFAATALFYVAGCGGDNRTAQSVPAQAPAADVPEMPSTTMALRQQVTQTEAAKIADDIYMARGFGNTFLVTTDAGNVIIDTSMPANAPAHKALLDAVDDRPADYIIITHAHGDHIGGLPHWKSENSKVIQQKDAEEFMHYQKRLAGFFQRRNAAQFGFELPNAAAEMKTENYAADIPADILFDQAHSFKLGGLTFDVISMPSETHDALSVWVPEHKAVFVGDLYYESFPNIYTLRGTKPRWALDYVASVNKVLALKPEILIPSHGEPVYGNANIEATLTKYRDAILYVHDAVVSGMNAGKGVDELASSIALPEDLKLPEIYGRVDWSVRGIYLGYAGWFDGNASTMLGVDERQSKDALIALAGGTDKVAAQAQVLLEAKDYDQALSLADVVLASNPSHNEAANVRAAVLDARLAASRNFNEIGWLKAGKRELENSAGGK